MPRKSKSELSMVPNLGTPNAPEPPERLTESQAAIWASITGALPGDRFTPDVQPLLECYVRHVDTAAIIDREVDAFKVEWLKTEEGLKRFKTLTGMRGRETGTILALARSLRISVQSRYGARKAATQAAKGNRKKLWE